MYPLRLNYKSRWLFCYIDFAIYLDILLYLDGTEGVVTFPAFNPLNCNLIPVLLGPVMLKLLCSGGKDGSEQMESEACENNRSQEVISSVLADLSDCLTSEATCSLVSYLSLLVIQDGKSAFTFSQILLFCPHGLNIVMVFTYRR